MMEHFGVWGRNLFGILGDGTGSSTEIKHPTKIGSDSNWTDISVGRYFGLAKKANGDLYGLGANDYGQLGLGNNTNVFAPTLIQQNVSVFSAGYFHTLIIKTDGTLWGTGYNDYSGLGVNTSVAYTFQQESSKATNWASVCGTYYNSFGIKTNGTLWSAGSNTEGETGLGTPASLGSNEKADFTQVGTDTNWKSIAGGIYHTLGLKTNGELWSWGYNSNGKLGIGTVTDVNIPTRVGTDTNWASIPVRSGEYSSAAIKTDASLFSWGYDGFWQLGNSDGTSTNSSVPTQVTCTDDVLAVNNTAADKKVFLYPNPAKDIVMLESTKPVSEVKIYNLSGAIVKSFTKIIDNKITISDLVAGVYIVNINGSTESLKLIKK